VPRETAHKVFISSQRGSRVAFFGGFSVAYAGVRSVLRRSSRCCRTDAGTTAYDSSKSLKLKGTVTSFEWINPHASLAWDVKTEKGGIEHWVVELTSPGMLTRSGWHHDSVKAGDEVTVYLHPTKTGTKWGIFQRVVFADGRPDLIDPRQP
jgi:hypothetical protein